jgi:beta-glucosidase
LAGKIPAILEAWHLGSQAGLAVADVLFGDYNPSGKLPVSFPRSLGQLPLYYNHLSTGRPTNTGLVFWSHYTDQPNEPLYPFGYGLSYTTFEYSDLTLSSEKMEQSGELKVSVKVKNSGDMVASISRPVKELKKFTKVMIQPGESKEIEFILKPDDLSFYNPNGQFIVEPGAFKIWVGTNSAVGLESGFTLE